MKSLSERSMPVASLYVKSFSGTARPDPEYAIREVFRKARKTAPCLLIFEDVDSLVTEATRSYFLNEVDGLEKNNGVLMIGSTNHCIELYFKPLVGISDELTVHNRSGSIRPGDLQAS